MSNDGSNPKVINCTFSGNTADYGGGMYNDDSHGLTVTNSTFSGNTATINGGGMCNWDSSSPTVTNCIVWNNTSDEIYNSGSTPVISYSIVKGGFIGTGNLNKDPLFADSAAKDFHLQESSPAIDKGSNAAVPSGISIDLDGNSRIIGGVVDMGAYEYDGSILPGDVNGDKVLDLKDAILALKIVAGAAGDAAINLPADVNGDGKIGMEEAIYVLQNVGTEG